MIEILTPKQAKEAMRIKQTTEQLNWAERGISTAIENGEIVTIGDSDCDYMSWKHFVVAQIFSLGIKGYVAKTNWDPNELAEDLAEEDPDSDIWKEDVIGYFNGMEGNY